MRNGLDRLWSDIVLQRAGHRCERCKGGWVDTIHPHHVKAKKSWPSLRHEPENGVALCPDCHTLGPDAAHRKPRAFLLWFKSRWPGRFDSLSSLAKTRMREDPKDTKQRLQRELRK